MSSMAADARFRALLLGKYFGEFHYPGYDLVYRPLVPSPRNTLAEILRDLAPWEPEVVVFRMPEYFMIPADLHRSPLPAVALVGDWNLGFSSLRGCLGAFNHIFTDSLGVERLRAAGYGSVEYMPLFGFNPAVHRVMEGLTKEYDVTFIGNFNHQVQRERAWWLQRLAALSGRFRVRLLTALEGEDYARVVNQSRITFNRSIRGEMNMRAYEAPACRSLMLLEEENREVREFFEDRVHCVLYNERNLAELLEHYLSHDDEREAIVARAYEKVRRYRDEDQLLRALERIREIGPAQLARLPRRDGGVPEVEVRKKRAYHAFLSRLNPLWLKGVQADLEAVERERPSDPENYNNYGVLFMIASDGLDEARAVRLLDNAAKAFTAALQACGTYVVCLVNFAELCALRGDPQGARTALEAAACLLEREGDAEELEGFLYPYGYDAFRVEREMLMARTAGDPGEYRRRFKALLLWKVSMALGEHYLDAGELDRAMRSFRRAALAHPADGRSHHLAAMVHLRQGKTSLAARELNRALKTTPLAFEVRLDLAHLHLDSGNPAAARALLAESLAMLRAIPFYEKLVPVFEAGLACAEAPRTPGRP